MTAQERVAQMSTTVLSVRIDSSGGQSGRIPACGAEQVILFACSAESRIGAIASLAYCALAEISSSTMTLLAGRKDEDLLRLRVDKVTVEVVVVGGGEKIVTGIAGCAGITEAVDADEADEGESGQALWSPAGEEGACLYAAEVATGGWDRVGHVGEIVMRVEAKNVSKREGK
jgi:hypothetical protein